MTLIPDSKIPEPDSKVMKESLEDFRTGRFQLVEEMIKELEKENTNETN